MTPPSRATSAGRAYLDLQKQARVAHRPVDEYLQFYVLECFLARLSSSRHVDRFILKGGLLPMSLSLFSSGGGTDLLPGQDGIGEFYGGGDLVAGAVLTGFPDGVVVVAGSLDCPGVGPLAARVEVPGAGDLGDDLAEDLFPLVRGERPQGRRPGGG